MTQGSNALKNFKKTIGRKRFSKDFPIVSCDAYVRDSYKGGFTYLNPDYASVDVAEGIVLDVNSLYPSVMYYEELPYGEGKYFKGEYEPDKIYNLYVTTFRCNFEVKPDHIPCLGMKGNLSFLPTEYVTSSDGEDVVLCMTSVDYKLFREHYEVKNVEFFDGWKFKGTTGLFKEYIDYWMGVKIQASKDGNDGMRTLAKLMLNALYGKFGLRPDVRSKYPAYNAGKIKYSLGPREKRKPVYIPAATFITAYARAKTIRSAQAVKHRFIYADTDSLHLEGTEMPTGLDIDEYRLGAWKVESHFTRARFIRAKTYIEEINGKLNIKCAGMPSKCYEHVTWDNFKAGSSFEGKLAQLHVEGGIVFKDTSFTIKER